MGKRLRKKSWNKRGVSTVMVAVYGAIMAILLISALFLGLATMDESVITYLQNEQDRSQERIIVAEFKKTEVGRIYEYVRIENKGSITSRIKAIYINGKFYCDPSTFPGDSFIPPQSYKWIQLFPTVNPPITEDVALDYNWTVLTERGTKSVPLSTRDFEPPINRTGGFYWGPIYFYWDSFHLETGRGPNLNYENGPWRNGWLVSRSTNTGITWRIRIENVDTQGRNITLNDQTCFTISGIESANNKIKPWFIDGILNGANGAWTGRSGNMTLVPGNRYYLYYTWTTNTSNTIQTVSFDAPMITTNFLTFTGNFIEHNGTRTPFGETVPLEAILVTRETMAATLDLTSNPNTIPNDGTSTSTLTATVTDGNGDPVQGAQVVFFTSAGTLSATTATTDASGIARVTLTSSLEETTAQVAAICQEVVIGYAYVVFAGSP